MPALSSSSGDGNSSSATTGCSNCSCSICNSSSQFASLPTIPLTWVRPLDNDNDDNHHRHQYSTTTRRRSNLSTSSVGLSKATISIPDDDERLPQHARLLSLMDKTFHVLQRQSSSRVSHEAALIASLYHPTHFPFFQVYAKGDGFLVVDEWNETLRSRLVRLRSRSSSSSSTKKYYYTLSLVVSEIALPLVRLLKHLHCPKYSSSSSPLNKNNHNNHNNNRVSYNVLNLDTVAFTNSGRLILIDFSKATTRSMDHSNQQDDHESFDVACWGRLIKDVLRFLRLKHGGSSSSSSSNNSGLDNLLESCCHEDPMQRPKLLILQKRLLEEWKSVHLHEVTTSKGSTEKKVANNSNSKPFRLSFKEQEHPQEPHHKNNHPSRSPSSWLWKQITKRHSLTKRGSSSSSSSNNSTALLQLASNHKKSAASLLQQQDIDEDENEEILMGETDDETCYYGSAEILKRSTPQTMILA